MKKLILVVFLAFSFTVKSQDFAPIGAKWYYNTAAPTGNPAHLLITYQVKGDTLLQNQVCSIVGDENSEYYLYQSGAEVFFWHGSQFHKVFDFSVNPGDTAVLTCRLLHFDGATLLDSIIQVQCVVDSTEFINVEGISLKKVFARSLPHSAFSGAIYPYFRYMERLGSEYQLMIPTVVDAFVGTLPRLRCYKDENVEYILPWWEETGKNCDHSDPVSIHQPDVAVAWTTFPNPAKEILHIAFPEALGQGTLITLTDLQGRKCLEKLMPPGTQTENLQISYLLAGTYFLHIQQNGKRMGSKIFVKQ
ncbi:MAG: T9SS type A sorting domain-containing protein [Flavobacteriales bacterium]